MEVDISTSALLWVDDPPAYYIEQLQNFDATERDNVMFECRVSRPNAEVEWMIGNELLQETDRVIFLSDDMFRRLLIDDVRMDEAGEYTNHIVGQDTRCSANMTVTGKMISMSLLFSILGYDIFQVQSVEVAVTSGICTLVKVDVEISKTCQNYSRGRRKLRSKTSPVASKSRFVQESHTCLWEVTAFEIKMHFCD